MELKSTIDEVTRLVLINKWASKDLSEIENRISQLKTQLGVNSLDDLESAIDNKDPNNQIANSNQTISIAELKALTETRLKNLHATEEIRTLIHQLVETPRINTDSLKKNQNKNNILSALIIDLISSMNDVELNEELSQILLDCSE